MGYDNQGFEVGEPESAGPILASGKTFHASQAATDYSALLSCGDQYCVTCNAEGPLLMGLTGKITSEANCEFIVPANGRLKFTIPENGSATRKIHFGSEKSECKGYGVRLDI